MQIGVAEQRREDVYIGRQRTRKGHTSCPSLSKAIGVSNFSRPPTPVFSRIN